MACPAGRMEGTAPGTEREWGDICAVTRDWFALGLPAPHRHVPVSLSIRGQAVQAQRRHVMPERYRRKGGRACRGRGCWKACPVLPASADRGGSLSARGLLLPGRHLGLDVAQEPALFRGPEQGLQLACPGRGQAGEHAHQDGREHGAFAQAHDAAQHGKAEKARGQDQRAVEQDLDVAEVLAGTCRDDDDQAFAGDDRGIAHDLKTDARAQHGTAHDAHDDLPDIDVRDQRAGEVHPEVDEHAEDEHGRDLQELRDAQPAPEQDALEQQEDQVAGKGRGAQGQAKDGGQGIRQGRDGGGAQVGLGDQGDAQGVEEQRDGKTTIPFDDIRSFHDGPLARGMSGK